MSSGATLLSRKRTHSLEQGGDRSGPDINTKKPRTSSEAPSNRTRKRKQAKKKRNVPVVEDIAGSSSTRSHNDGAELMSPEVQHRGGCRRKPRRMVESDDEDASIIPGPASRSQVTQKSQINSASPSLSPSLKGKEREADPVPSVSALNAEDLSKKTEELSQKLDTQTTKLAIHSALISSFKESLTCQICVGLMYKPFSLAPCGHTACYSCLVGWFKSNAAEGDLGPQSVHRKKTCPHCRSTVRDRPTENFTIKEMVDALVNSGVLEDVSGAAATAIGVPATSGDPWADIFPKHPVRENNYDGLPFAIFDEGEDEDHGHGEGGMAIYDDEDDVYRCRGCMNEVVNGFCTSCEREYQPPWAAEPLLGGFFGGYGDGWWGDDVDSDSEEEEEYLPEGYEESFIDDDGEVGDVPGSDNGAPTLPLLREDSEDGDDETIEASSPAVVPQRNRQAPIVISSDDEDNGGYTSASTPDYGRFWDENEAISYHDARSDSDDLGDENYWSDEERYDDGDRGFYGYL